MPDSRQLRVLAVSEGRKHEVAEFIAVTATIMMLIAFAIDAMLPALPEIGTSLGVADRNAHQWVISIFMLGFGGGQLVMGPIADSLGRRHVLIAGLAIYLVACVIAASTDSFEALLGARLIQGMAAAGTRIAIVAMVRDRFVGAAMAQVMSFSQVVFMVAPIIAPLLGQAVLEVADWRWIFLGLAAGASAMLLLGSWRLPESMTAENRQPLNIVSTLRNWREVIGDPNSRYFTLAGACLNVGFTGFLVSVQQIFEQTIGDRNLLPLGFAIISTAVAAASLVNGIVVKRVGMVKILRIAVITYVIVAAFALLHSLLGDISFQSFVALQAMLMVSAAFAGGNLGALAMLNMGRMAGSAASLQGSLSIMAGVFGGSIIGQAYDGSTLPLYIGAMIFGGFSAIIVFFVAPIKERTEN
ncbi:MAG: multidrug effflux MFS transporter [Sphingomonadaceae bacterium]|nr:multidrug effflux MFS transporter [Sphingomonadaceae bacterium]